jgi:hypothetical protein
VRRGLPGDAAGGSHASSSMRSEWPRRCVPLRLPAT